MTEGLKGLPDTVIDRSFFVHNVFGSFFRGVLDWVGDEFYPRFEYKVIGTYDKAVEFFQKQLQFGHETDVNILPSVTLDPQLDFSQEERTGKLFWQNQYFDPGLAFRTFDRINLLEQDMLLVPVYSRYQGTFELLFWLSSVMELMDFRIHLLQYTGGFNRYIRPKLFWSYIILPDRIHQYESDEGITIDWGNTDANLIQVDSINKKKWALPCLLNPYFRLDSFNDNSIKYGTDSVSEHKLSATFTYEIGVPTYMILKTKLGGKIQLNIHMGKVQTRYGFHKKEKVVRSLQKQEQHRELRMAEFWRLSKSACDGETRIFKIGDNSKTYPSSKHIIKDNHIKTGQLKIAGVSENIDKYDIVYFPNYTNTQISLLRKSQAALCLDPTLYSTIYAKCEILDIPLIMDSEMDDIRQYENQIITVDALKGEIWLGEVASELIPSDDEEYGYYYSKYLEVNEPEDIEEAKSQLRYQDSVPHLQSGVDISLLNRQLIYENVDGVQTQFTLEFTPEYPTLYRMFVDGNPKIYDRDFIIDGNIVTFVEPPREGANLYIGGGQVEISDIDLIALYEFTEDDLALCQPIEVDFPIDIETPYDIVLVSYNGQMIYERDYEIDKENRVLRIKLKPQLDEVVEIFRAYRDGALS